MARRPRTPAPAHAVRPRHPRRPAAIAALLTAASLALTACSVTLNPGPGEEIVGGAEAIGGGAAPQLGEAAAPVVVAEGTTVQGPDAGTVAVRPAPRASSDRNGDGNGDGSGTSDDGGTTAGDSETVSGDDDAGAPGGSGGGTGTGTGNAGAPGDLSDPVHYAAALEAEVNLRREQNGRTALTHDDCAYQVALERAEALRGKDLAHAPLDPIFDRCPTSTVGENLARGGWSPAEAADGWMNSEGHRANILNAGFTRGAIACISEDTSYGAQMTCAHVFLG